ncbi:unnamed protein product [Microthlaspi erraticum]|uniref:Acyl-coenzyme A oxidase n=1 Tax=Microthlaspi erraticum TaxID=1685480 RepID=A0A6D2I964_9BRAS|nr:unnamed protein product [Microthlaspi erraticum]
MSENRSLRRVHVLTSHILRSPPPPPNVSLTRDVCLQYSPPELNESYGFEVKEMRKLLDGHNLEDRDWLYGLMMQSNLFSRKERGGKIFVSPDYNQTMEQQREISMRRIYYLLEKGVFHGWLTESGPEAELKKFALYEVCAIYDHSINSKIGVHFLLWGNAIKLFGTKRHHEKWLKDTEEYLVKGCFAMTELGHGSNVRGIETVTTYDSSTEEFVINTPCESAQKYWIGEAALNATHAIVISQLNVNGTSQGIHVFIAQIRDQDGNICPNVRIADCGHKIGLNGVDNGRIWFDNLRIPRENLLNSVADVSSDGQYVSSIKDPDQRFGAFLAPLTSGRVTIASIAIYSAKVGLAIAIRYSLSRRAFTVAANGPEVLLLDYPSHQRRLLPLLAKTYAMSFAINDMKMKYVKRTPETTKAIHVVSSGFKAVLTWHNMRTLQECREAVGGQGVKTENVVGHLKGEFDTNVFSLRERDLLERFTSEVSQLQDRGESKELSFLLNHQLSEELSKAFTEKAIMQTFLDAEAKQPAGSIKDVLGLVRSMYALVSLEEDPSMLRYGYLSRENVGDVRREVSKLCGELRPHALALVTSFGIPDAFLGPIAFNWVEANAWSSV